MSPLVAPLLFLFLVVAPPALAAEAPPVPDCGCPSEDAPVCGADGNTYASACVAVCAGIRVAEVGACSQPAAADSARGPQEAEGEEVPGGEGASGGEVSASQEDAARADGAADPVGEGGPVEDQPPVEGDEPGAPDLEDISAYLPELAEMTLADVEAGLVSPRYPHTWKRLGLPPERFMDYRAAVTRRPLTVADYGTLVQRRSRARIAGGALTLGIGLGAGIGFLIAGIRENVEGDPVNSPGPLLISVGGILGAGGLLVGGVSLHRGVKDRRAAPGIVVDLEAGAAAAEADQALQQDN